MKLKPSISRDSDTLAALGKKQVLKRRFGFWSLFGCVFA
jgi:choline transport protein